MSATFHETPKPILTPTTYQNPFMAPNNYSEIHFNSYQTDTCSIKGPATALRPALQQGLLDPPGVAGTLAFNSAGQIITIRVASGTPGSDHPESSESTGQVSGKTNVELLLIERDTLNVLASTYLPGISKSTSGVSFGGGGYFYLNNQDQVVCVTTVPSLAVYSVRETVMDGAVIYGFELVKQVALENLLEATDILNSVLPDSAGNLWFISHGGVVGYVDTVQDAIHSTTFVQPDNAPRNASPITITKSFATDGEGGVYVVTNEALYRFQAGENGPQTVWRAHYDRGARTKPGQNQQGSGTTPTCFDDFEGNQFVAITDNADPCMHVNIYERKSGRLVAQQTVFTDLPYISSCENSLIAVNHSIILENNYNNIEIQSTLGALTTVPGLNRVDFDPATGESWIVWHNNRVSVPSVVSQLSTADGCIYTYAKDAEGWYFAAIDFETGKVYAQSEVVPWSCHLGGALANNYYSGMTIGPDSSAYVGVVGGIVVWRC